MDISQRIYFVLFTQKYCAEVKNYLLNTFKFEKLRVSQLTVRINLKIFNVLITQNFVDLSRWLSPQNVNCDTSLLFFVIALQTKM